MTENQPQQSQRQHHHPPPQLILDDGSRIIREAEVNPHNNNVTAISVTETPTARGGGDWSVRDFYEIDRLSSAVVVQLFSSSNNDSPKNVGSATNNNDSSCSSTTHSSCCRVALQFPDELLVDAPQVVWEMEQALQTKLPLHNDILPLVFILGDTTFGPCCPDEVAARHLQAHILIHYGHACLTPSSSTSSNNNCSCSSSHQPPLPVLYSFGRTLHHFPFDHCVQSVLHHLSSLHLPRRVVLLYQVKYHYAMEDLQTQLSERGDVLVITGQVPEPNHVPVFSFEKNGHQHHQHHHCNENENDTINTCTDDEDQGKMVLVLGGLELPSRLDWSSYTLLYVGDVSDEPPFQKSQHQWIQILLRFLSTTSSSSSSSLSSIPTNIWLYSPESQTLDTTSPLLSNSSSTNNNNNVTFRILQRRFYLIQRARDASVFGIVLGTLSTRYFQNVVQQLRISLEQAGRSVYVMAVGKINAAKLANFADIECFVLVACPEQYSDMLLQDRSGGGVEFHAPILTPLEVQMAIGTIDWGSMPYSLDDQDFLDCSCARSKESDNVKTSEQDDNDHNRAEDDHNNDDDDDAPYFSLVTGTYQRKKYPISLQTTTTATAIVVGADEVATAVVGSVNGGAAPPPITNTVQQHVQLQTQNNNTEQALISFSSSAASFLQQRPYRGLEPQWGETPPQVATVGRSGIASNYGENENSTDEAV